jgi:hypothetical protein
MYTHAQSYGAPADNVRASSHKPIYTSQQPPQTMQLQLYGSQQEGPLYSSAKNNASDLGQQQNIHIYGLQQNGIGFGGGAGQSHTSQYGSNIVGSNLRLSSSNVAGTSGQLYSGQTQYANQATAPAPSTGQTGQMYGAQAQHYASNAVAQSPIAGPQGGQSGQAYSAQAQYASTSANQALLSGQQSGQTPKLAHSQQAPRTPQMPYTSHLVNGHVDATPLNQSHGASSGLYSSQSAPQSGHLYASGHQAPQLGAHMRSSASNLPAHVPSNSLDVPPQLHATQQQPIHAYATHTESASSQLYSSQHAAPMFAGQQPLYNNNNTNTNNSTSQTQPVSRQLYSSQGPGLPAQASQTAPNAASSSMYGTPSKQTFHNNGQQTASTQVYGHQPPHAYGGQTQSLYGGQTQTFSSQAQSSSAHAYTNQAQQQAALGQSYGAQQPRTPSHTHANSSSNGSQAAGTFNSAQAKAMPAYSGGSLSQSTPNNLGYTATAQGYGAQLRTSQSGYTTQAQAGYQPQSAYTASANNNTASNANTWPRAAPQNNNPASVASPNVPTRGTYTGQSRPQTQTQAAHSPYSHQLGSTYQQTPPRGMPADQFRPQQQQRAPPQSSTHVSHGSNTLKLSGSNVMDIGGLSSSHGAGAYYHGGGHGSVSGPLASNAPSKHAVSSFRSCFPMLGTSMYVCACVCVHEQMA